MDAVIAAVVALWFFVFAGYAAAIGTDAIRTRTYLPRLGLALEGGVAVAAGWATLVLAAAFFGAGALVTFVAARA